MEIERKKLLRLKIQNKYPNAILSPFSYKEFEKINDSKFTEYKQTIDLKILESKKFPILFLILQMAFCS